MIVMAKRVKPYSKAGRAVKAKGSFGMFNRDLKKKKATGSVPPYW